MKNDRFIIQISVRSPDQYTKTDVVNFVRDAVQCWGGQLHPEDELFHLCKDATAKIVRKKP